MTKNSMRIAGLSLIGALALTACGGGRDLTPTGNVGAGATPGTITADHRRASGQGSSSIWDIFRPSKAENTVAVNRYIWQASLDVLDFLPIQSVDPFTGVIVTGYGTPPGGGWAYRATVYVSDPALDARSLKVALQSRGGGAVSTATQRAVEDAILARARQLRGADSRL